MLNYELLFGDNELLNFVTILHYYYATLRTTKRTPVCGEVFGITGIRLVCMAELLDPIKIVGY